MYFFKKFADTTILPKCFKASKSCSSSPSPISASTKMTSPWPLPTLLDVVFVFWLLKTK